MLHACSYEWKESEREFLRALELNSGSEEARAYYCLFYLVPTGRLNEAAALLQQALEFNPLSPSLQSTLAAVYFMVQQYDRAIEQSRNALKLDPHFYLAHLVLGQSYIERGEIEEGVRAHESIVRQRAPSFAAGPIGWAYARAGRITEAQKILEKSLAPAKREYVLPSSVARIYLGLNDIDKALVWLEKAVDEHDSGLFMMVWAEFIRRRLGSHPR